MWPALVLRPNIALTQNTSRGRVGVGVLLQDTSKEVIYNAEVVVCKPTYHMAALYQPELVN